MLYIFLVFLAFFSTKSVNFKMDFDFTKSFSKSMAKSIHRNISRGYITTDTADRCLVDYTKIYTLGIKIGQGASGVVYECTKIGDPEPYYTLKELVQGFSREENPDDYSLVVNFVREIRLLSTLNHPAVLSLEHFVMPHQNDKTSTPKIITRYMKGGTLNGLLKSHLSKRTNAKMFTGTQKSMCIYGIAGGMMYIHSKNVIHRDLKPDNVFLDAVNHPVIADFGLSRMFDTSQGINMTMGIGTPVFMAPELIDGTDTNYTNAVDVYAFGILLYNFFVDISTSFALDDNGGKISSQFQLYRRIKKGARPVRHGSIDDKWWNLITLCWDPSPANRPTFSDIMIFLRNPNNQLWFDQTDMEEYKEYMDLIDKAQVTLDDILDDNDDDEEEEDNFVFD